MFPDYERLVMDDYRQKKADNILSSLLIHPTQAKLKRACEQLCKGELLKKDEKVIRDFCEEWDNDRTCLQNIGDCDVDKFKPLSNFLKKEKGSTDPINIELLACLIDFSRRPYELGKKYEVGEGVQVEEDEQSCVDGTLNDSLRNQEEGKATIAPLKPKRKFSKTAKVGVLLGITGVAVLVWWIISWPKDGACMYWANDHFEQIPCSKQVPNTLIIALDTAKANHLKKLTCKDSIINRGKGNVWYSKINNVVEFFTADGEHPVVRGRHLKPATNHIIETYAK